MTTRSYFRQLARKLYSDTAVRASRSSVDGSVRVPPRLLCLDVGMRHVGVAVSDMSNFEALPHSTIERRAVVQGSVPRRLSWQNVAAAEEFEAPRELTKPRSFEVSSLRSQTPDISRTYGARSSNNRLKLNPFNIHSMRSRHQLELARDREAGVDRAQVQRERQAAAQRLKNKPGRGSKLAEQRQKTYTIPLPFDEVATPISRLATELDVAGIVVGQPLTLDGKRDWQCHEVRAFVDALQSFDPTLANTDFFMWDERYSTQKANEQIRLRQERFKKQMKHGSKRWRRHVDKVAAAVILQDFIDQLCAAVGVQRP